MMTSPRVTLPVIESGRINLVTTEPYDWTPTAESRAEWMATYYPRSTP